MRSDKEMEKHLKLLADAFYEHLDVDMTCEFGSIGLDCKRPFGNSYVEGDILDIIGLHDRSYDDGMKEYARELYFDKLIPYLVKEWKKYHKSKSKKV